MAAAAENINPLKGLLGDKGYERWLANADKPFRPCATYFRAMDHLIYLGEDVSYRAKHIDSSLDVLLHPQEDRVIGVKVSGFAAIVEREPPYILGPRALLRALAI